MAKPFMNTGNKAATTGQLDKHGHQISENSGRIDSLAAQQDITSQEIKDLKTIKESETRIPSEKGMTAYYTLWRFHFMN